MNVSHVSSPDLSEPNSQLADQIHVPLTSSRNMPRLHATSLNQSKQNWKLAVVGNSIGIIEEAEDKMSPPHQVKFREKGLLNNQIKHTTPNCSNPSSQYSTINNLQAKQINSPSTIKVIDLRNPQIRKLVMNSVNEIVAERKKQKTAHNSHYDQILQSTPKTLIIHNSLNQDAVLIEKGNLSEQIQNQNDSQPSHVIPPSRLSTSNLHQQNPNNGILRMSPRSQSKFFTSLHKIHEEQEQRNLGQEDLQQQNSPEYTIVSAIDDSCVLFAVKETQNNPAVVVKSEVSSFESTLKQITPAQIRNVHDPQGGSLFDNADMYFQLTQRLRGIENQENYDNNPKFKTRDHGLVEQYSTDKQFLIIHPKNIKRLNPSMKSPQVSRQPSQTQLNYFDLSNPQHADFLFHRLNLIRDLEDHQREVIHEVEEEASSHVEQEESTDNLTTIFLSYLDDIENNQQNQNNPKTPSHSLVPPSRAGHIGDQIDIEVLINKLLEIPNETLLDSIINISRESRTPNNLQLLSQQNSEINLARGDSDRASIPSSSGGGTPQSHSLSTPIQAKLMQDRQDRGQYFFNNHSNFNNNGLAGMSKGRGLDLKSPQTKFNLMRKLNAVKEQNNSDEEEDHEEGIQHVPEINEFDVAGSRIQIRQQEQREADQYYGNNLSGKVELRALNDYTRLFINEEDEEQEEFENEKVRGEHTKPISLSSPQRSLNSTQNNLQLRNQNQFQPSIELLIQKLKHLEQKRQRQGNFRQMRPFFSFQGSEQNSPQKKEKNQTISVNSTKLNNRKNDQAQNILEEVIKRLERLKSRDSSV